MAPILERADGKNGSFQMASSQSTPFGNMSWNAVTAWYDRGSPYGHPSPGLNLIPGIADSLKVSSDICLLI